MTTSEERRWQRIQEHLLAESQGAEPARLCSTRTLFGIKSHAEEVIERTVSELEKDVHSPGYRSSSNKLR